MKKREFIIDRKTFSGFKKLSLAKLMPSKAYDELTYSLPICSIVTEVGIIDQNAIAKIGHVHCFSLLFIFNLLY